MNYEVVIGLEVHAELQTETKIFCGCAARFGGEPNTDVCPVCAGMPGVLPVLNQKVVEFAIMAGVALNCEISPYSKFDRKNYFYPDLPKGFQVSQFDKPLCVNGFLEVPLPSGNRHIRINRIHMEEDAGKLVHQGSAGLAGADYSLVDLNRAGVPLLEIVSEPDIRSIEEARAYLQELRLVLMVLGVNDGRLEEGSLRCDANVSIRPEGATELGTRVEIKNLNSFKFLQKALEFEVARQIRAVEAGDRIVQETRLWSEEKNQTYAMRSKEEASDYRYFPEPDLVPLAINSTWVNDLTHGLPELPAKRRVRYITAGLTPYDTAVLTADRNLAQVFDEASRDTKNLKALANWLIGDVTALLNDRKLALADISVQSEMLARLVDLVESGRITGSAAKKLLPEVVLDGKDPAVLIAERGLEAMADAGQLRDIVRRVLEANSTQVAEYKSGKTKVMGFLVGQVIRESKGRAVPEVVTRVLGEEMR